MAAAMTSGFGWKSGDIKHSTHVLEEDKYLIFILGSADLHPPLTSLFVNDNVILYLNSKVDSYVNIKTPPIPASGSRRVCRVLEAGA
jgi:hypothetical protein